MTHHGGSIGRRDLLKLAALGGTTLMTAGMSGWVFPAEAAEVVATKSRSMSSEEALQRLLDGNQRFVQQKREYPHQSIDRLKEVAQSQSPFATILSCADSRVPAEILFDVGIGDIFDIRVAGNVVTPAVLGSLEYAVAMLKSPLVMILGHERCGAVTAAVKGGELPGSISMFVNEIAPSLSKVKSKSGDSVDNAVIANVKYQIDRLKQDSEIIAQRWSTGRLKVVGGRYDLDTGMVTLLT